MPIIHITKAAVEKLEKPAAGRVDYFDDVLRGFGIRVSPTVKTYFTMRRVNGKLVRAKVDTADKITAEQARKRAEGILADMGRGQDPNEEKRQAKRQVQAARREEEAQKSQVVTLANALESYLEKRKLKPKTQTVYRQMFRLHLSDWLQLPAGEITSPMVGQRHTDIATGARRRTALQKTVKTDKASGQRTVEKAKVSDTLRREASADGTMRVLRAVLIRGLPTWY